MMADAEMRVTLGVRRLGAALFFGAASKRDFVAVSQNEDKLSHSRAEASLRTPRKASSNRRSHEK